MLIVDGYNVIFNADRYKSVRKTSLDLAVDRLVNDLINLAVHEEIEVLVVFDGKQKSSRQLGPVTVVFTAKEEKADTYISRAVHNLKQSAIVCTNDYLLQKTIFRPPDILRMTVSELMEKMKK